MVRKKISFHELAVDSFDATYRAIFEQSHREVARLHRINEAMDFVEHQLLDPERLQEMDTMQYIALMELLGRSQQSIIKNVMSFGGMLEKVKTVVGIHDGIQGYTSLPSSPTDDFPLLSYDE